MNPAEYARHVGTSRQNINNVESGEALQPRYIGKLAKAMGLSVDELMGGAVPQQASAAAQDHAGGNIAYLAELLPKLTPAQQEQLIGLADQLAGPFGHLVTVTVTLVLPASEPTATPARAR